MQTFVFFCPTVLSVPPDLMLGAFMQSINRCPCVGLPRHKIVVTSGDIFRCFIRKISEAKAITAVELCSVTVSSQTLPHNNEARLNIHRIYAVFVTCTRTCFADVKALVKSGKSSIISDRYWTTRLYSRTCTDTRMTLPG